MWKQQRLDSSISSCVLTLPLKDRSLWIKYMPAVRTHWQKKNFGVIKHSYFKKKDSKNSRNIKVKLLFLNSTANSANTLKFDSSVFTNFFFSIPLSHFALSHLALSLPFLYLMSLSVSLVFSLFLSVSLLLSLFFVVFWLFYFSQAQLLVSPYSCFL